MILGGEILPVLAGDALMLRLRRQRSLVALVHRHLFLPRWTRFNPALSAVVTDISRVVHDHGLVVNIRDIGDADIGDRAVVVEIPSSPFAAHKSHSGITESIINAAVKPNMRPPISRVPSVESATPSPVTGRP